MISSSLFISVIIQDIWPTATTKSKPIERTTRTVWHPTKLKDKGLFLTRHRIPFDHVFVRLARKCYNNKLVWPFPVSWHRSIDVVNAKCTAYSYKMCPRCLERWDIWLRFNWCEVVSNILERTGIKYTPKNLLSLSHCKMRAKWEQNGILQ